MDGNTGTLMLLSEALKSNTGIFFPLSFTLSEQTSGELVLNILTLELFRWS